MTSLEVILVCSRGQEARLCGYLHSQRRGGALFPIPETKPPALTHVSWFSESNADRYILALGCLILVLGC